MKLILFFLILSTNIFFAQQQVTSKKNAIELATGYANLGSKYNGVHLTASYNHMINKFLETNTKLHFAQGNSKLIAPFQSITLDVGATGVLSILSKSMIKVGIELGVSQLDYGFVVPNTTYFVQHIRYDFIFTYGGSAAYLFKLNTTSQLGLQYTFLKNSSPIRNLLQTAGITYIKSF